MTDRQQRQALHATESYVGATQVRGTGVLEAPVRQRFSLGDTAAEFGETPLDIPLGEDSLMEAAESLVSSRHLHDSPSIKPLRIATHYLNQLARRRSRAHKPTDVGDPLRTTRSRASQLSNSNTATISCDCGTALENFDLVRLLLD